MDAESAAGLWALCRACGATMMRGALAAWAVLLGKHSGQEDVVVGVPYANRDHPALQEVVGYFVNMMVVRVGVGRGLSFREVVVATRSSMQSALSHAVVPFLNVVDVAGGNVDSNS